MELVLDSRVRVSALGVAAYSKTGVVIKIHKSIGGADRVLVALDDPGEPTRTYHPNHLTVLSSPEPVEPPAPVPTPVPPAPTTGSRITRTFTTPGTKSVTLKVKDAAGQVAQKTGSIFVK